MSKRRGLFVALRRCKGPLRPRRPLRLLATRPATQFFRRLHARKSTTVAKNFSTFDPRLAIYPSNAGLYESFDVYALYLP